MSESKINEVIKQERTFLHDISNQLLISHGMTNILMNKVEVGAAVDEKMIDRLQKAYGALEKMVTMVKERRDNLIKKMEEE